MSSSTSHYKHYGGQPRPSGRQVLDRQQRHVLIDRLLTITLCHQILANIGKCLRARPAPPTFTPATAPPLWLQTPPRQPYTMVSGVVCHYPACRKMNVGKWVYCYFVCIYVVIVLIHGILLNFFLVFLFCANFFATNSRQISVRSSRIHGSWTEVKEVKGSGFI